MWQATRYLLVNLPYLLSWEPQQQCVVSSPHNDLQFRDALVSWLWLASSDSTEIIQHTAWKLKMIQGINSMQTGANHVSSAVNTDICLIFSLIRNGQLTQNIFSSWSVRARHHCYCRPIGNHFETFLDHWHPDDDRIVSHDAPRFMLYYHCVRDTSLSVIFSTREVNIDHSARCGWFPNMFRFSSFCFWDYRVGLYSLCFKGEFQRYFD